MRRDAEEALCRYEAYQAKQRRDHQRFGIAIILTALFLVAIGVAVAK